MPQASSAGTFPLLGIWDLGWEDGQKEGTLDTGTGTTTEPNTPGLPERAARVLHNAESGRSGRITGAGWAPRAVTVTPKPALSCWNRRSE